MAAAQIGPHGLNCPDWSPGNAPPSQHERQYCPGQSFCHGAFTGTNKVNIGAALERHGNDRKTPLILNESSAAFEFRHYFLLAHAMNADDLRHPISPFE